MCTKTFTYRLYNIVCFENTPSDSEVIAFDDKSLQKDQKQLRLQLSKHMTLRMISECNFTSSLIATLIYCFMETYI